MNLKIEVLDNLETLAILDEITLDIPDLEITGFEPSENGHTFVSIEAPTAMHFYRLGILMAERYYAEREPTCRYCGCTEDHACILEDDDGNTRTCAWAAHSVCDNPECLAAHDRAIAEKEEQHG